MFLSCFIQDDFEEFMTGHSIDPKMSIKPYTFKYGFYVKKNVAFTLISFAVLKWDECLSVQLPFQLPLEITFQLYWELELKWLNQDVNKLKFELSRSRWNRPLCQKAM